MKVEAKVNSAPPVRPRPLEEPRQPAAVAPPPAEAPAAKGPAHLGRSVDIKA